MKPITKVESTKYQEILYSGRKDIHLMKRYQNVKMAEYLLGMIIIKKYYYKQILVTSVMYILIKIL